MGNKWISIFKHKPKDGETVVLLLSSGNATIAKFDGYQFTEDGLLVENITHWISLPLKPTQKINNCIYNYEDIEELG
jgi:hypothetical protein